MAEFKATQTVGDIVAMLPKAGEVFKKHHIDFCCGGHRTLGEVVKEQGIDEQLVISELEQAQAEAEKLTDQVDFREMESADLADYVVNKHHVYLRKALPELSELTTTIMRVHGPHHSELFDVHKLFHNLKTELEQHLIKEEEILFPKIKQGASPDEIRATLEETEAEHDTAGDIVKELRKVTQDYKVPEDGCGTYHATYEKLQELEADLFQHIHLENNILFKRFA